jgi:hypothetical protein
VGIAMGAMGSDVAIEAADVALLGHDLRVLPDALSHAQRSMRIVRQNLLLSGAIVLTLIPGCRRGSQPFCCDCLARAGRGARDRQWVTGRSPANFVHGWADGAIGRPGAAGSSSCRQGPQSLRL